MYASLILSFLLFVTLGFFALVDLQTRACEGGVYHAPLTSAEEWSASLDVALGLSWLDCTPEEYAYTMRPLPRVGMFPTPTPLVQGRTMVRACPTDTLRTLAHICMC